MSLYKVVIVVGTRPNFIKITQFAKAFAQHGDTFEYKLIHTGQHYDQNMSKVFFEQLKLRKPDIFLNIKGLAPAAQIGNIIVSLQAFFVEYQPNLVIVVGDVNSTLAAAVAAHKSGIKVAHLESGLRSFDKEMPEEVNRLLTDQITDMYFVTEQSGIDNLQKDGQSDHKIHFVGNTMIDTLVAFQSDIEASPILNTLSVQPKEYALMTMHRPRNVDNKEGLEQILKIIQHITKYHKLVFPIHPRTAKNFQKHALYEQLISNQKLILTGPLDYLAFQKLIANSAMVLTDSGGIQEETTFKQVPCLTLRENTERPSTITVGTNELVYLNADLIVDRIDAIQNGTFKTEKGQGQIPPLWDGKATERIVEVIKANR